jgi:acetolactate synthase-1/2/3 large subunit
VVLGGTPPCLFISGQVKRSTCSHTEGVEGLRQFGVQELDIIPVVSSLCKYAVHLTKPEMVRYELEKAVSIAKSGRPGPVWIDIPMDVQSALIDPETLPAYTGIEQTPTNASVLDELRDMFMKAERPVIIAG